MLFSDAKGRKVVSTSTAETVGKVNAFVVDPTSRSVLAIHLKKAESGDTLRWSDVTGFGEDAVTVSGADVITVATADVAALSDKAHQVLGKRVLDSRGDDLGEIKDVDFDHTDGSITAFVLDSGRVAGSRLVGIGSYAVVVKAEVTSR